MTKKITFNYDKLRSMDMVVCAGRSPFAILTRIVTAGLKHATNHDIAVHIGVVFDLEGQKLIAEMRPRGLELNSLERYNKKGGRRWAIDIRRSSVYDNNAFRMDSQARIAVDLRRGLEYDYTGLVEFVSKRVNDSPDRAYCSEYFYQITKDKIHYPEEYAIKVSPRNLQAFSGFYPVADWHT